MLRYALMATGAVLAVSMAAQPALAQEVGKASAVNPAATANLRTITIGSSIAHKERIKTAAEGSVQILFVDKTSMTIGPNSDLTIDEYVYNPNAGTGKLAATLSKGALRFVGGQISHSGDAEIKTASSVVGIRGGVALITPQHVFAGYGTSTVTGPGGTVTLNAGEFTSVVGGTPTPPGAPPAGFVAGLIQSFQSAPGQSGGAPRGTASPSNVARAEARATGGAGAIAGQLTPVVNQIPVQRINPGATLTQTIQTTTQSTAAEATIANTPSHLKGFVGGMMATSREPGVMSAIIGLAELLINPSGHRVQANVAGGAYAGHDVPATLVFNYQYGSQNPELDPRSYYVDAKNFGALPAVDREGRPISTINGQALNSQSGAMYTVTAEQARQYAWARGYDLTVCACDYTRWGIWSSSSQQGGYSALLNDVASGFWVAGRPISNSDVPTVGQASYAGHVVAQVQNCGSSYISAGNLTTTVDFASRHGTAYVSNFDGLNYSGNLYVSPSQPQLTAGLNSIGSDRSMLLSGEFYRGRTSPVGEMGGAALVSGTNYLGSGIFAARMK